MTLAFDAPVVRCADAIDGQILQVTFDTVPESHDEEERSTPYVLISRNFESPDSATIEWHDGHAYDGGAEIVSITLGRSRVSIKVDRDLDLEVSFRLPDTRFVEMKSILRRMMDDRIRFTG